MPAIRRYWPYVVLLLLILANVFIVWQRQWIGDWLRLKDYQPPARIAALATDTRMTDEGKHLFYLNHPVLEDKEAFNIHCEDHDIETSVLGCFHGDRLGIYIYDVKDARLHGVLEVTAAHEMLHQAYERLNKGERTRINKLLTTYYDTGPLSETIKTKIDSYRKQPDVVLANEMHSFFGSEVRTLPAELETYYKRYFADRSKVVTLSEAYQGEFERRKQLVADYDAQLATLSDQIANNKADLERRSATLKEQEAAINAAIARQDYATYQGSVQTYNAQVETYNAKIGATRALIDRFNKIVADRNEIAVEEQELQQALDSNLSPAETQ